MDDSRSSFEPGVLLPEHLPDALEALEAGCYQCHGRAPVKGERMFAALEGVSVDSIAVDENAPRGARS